MAKYKGMVITAEGLKIISAAQTGGTIKFTAIKTGSGIYDGTEDLSAMTVLKEEKQTFGITGITRLDSDTIKVRSVFDNEELIEGYSITEIGLFARDETDAEVLYAVIVATEGLEDYLPAYSESPTSITLEIYENVSNVASDVEFKAEIIEGVYVTVQDFEDHRREMNDEMEAVNKKVDEHIADIENPHKMTAAQLGLDKVENTPDSSKNVASAKKLADSRIVLLSGDVSASASFDGSADLELKVTVKDNSHSHTISNVTGLQDALDGTYQQATGYTDNAIAELINGAPETLNTLSEIAEAMAENEDVVKALDEAVGKKANQTEMDTHIDNEVIHITADERNLWNKVKNKAEAEAVNSHISNSTVHITEAEHEALSDVVSKAHTHNNQTVLDSITEDTINKANASNLQTYTLLSQISDSLSTSNTILEVMKVLPENSLLNMYVGSTSSILRDSLPDKAGGTVTMKKGDASTIGYITYQPWNTADVYTANYCNGVLTWMKSATQSDYVVAGGETLNISLLNSVGIIFTSRNASSSGYTTAYLYWTQGSSNAPLLTALREGSTVSISGVSGRKISVANTGSSEVNVKIMSLT